MLKKTKKNESTNHQLPPPFPIQCTRRGSSTLATHHTVYNTLHRNGAGRCLHRLQPIAPSKTQVSKLQRWQIQNHLFWQNYYDTHQNLSAHHPSIYDRDLHFRGVTNKTNQHIGWRRLLLATMEHVRKRIVV